MNWLAKVVSSVLIELLPKLAFFIGRKIKALIESSKKKLKRKKQVKEIKDAESKEELDDSFDSLD